MNNAAIWIMIISAMVVCYFSSCNYALLDFSRTRLAELLRRNDDIDSFIAMRDDLLIATALMRVVSNLVMLIAAMVWIVPPNQSHSLAQYIWALVVVGMVIAVFGVAVPVSWSRYAAEPLLAQSITLLQITHMFSRPIIIMLHWFDPLIRRLLGVSKPDDDDREPLEQEIFDAVTEGQKGGLVDEYQKDMIEAVVEFPSTTVEQIMTPRTDIEGLATGSTLNDIKQFLKEAGHSRIPIYEGDLDHIIGILYVKDLIPLLGDDGYELFDLKKHVREAVFVPETKLLRDLLAHFKTSKVHIALVVDEYGGTAGLVTVEDVLEEIFGEIHDEYEPTDEEEPTIEQVGEFTWLVHGRVYINDLNDELHVELPEDEDYDTVGGFVFAALGRIPEIGETFERNDLRFTITDAEKTRINRVRIKVVGRTVDELPPPSTA